MKYVLIISGFAIFAILFGSCQDNEISKDEEQALPLLNYLALGDSYTYGQGIDYVGSWPVQLTSELSKNGVEVSTLEVIARTGWTTTDLLNAIGNKSDTNFSLVSLQIGVNNQFQNLPFSLFEMEFLQLLDSAVQYAGAKSRVFVLSIPDYGVTPFGTDQEESISREIDQYNTYIKTSCETYGIAYINVTEISRELGSSSMALAEDRLHPSASQYKLWVDELLPILLPQLTE